MIDFGTDQRDLPGYELERSASRPSPVRDERADDAWDDEDWEEDWLFL